MKHHPRETLYRQLVEEYREQERILADPAVYQDPQRSRDLLQKLKQRREVAERATQFLKLLEDFRALKELEQEGVLDEELLQEAQELETRLLQLDQELQRLLLPRDPDLSRNAVLEIRAGAGGEEAALFAADLMRMYTRYAERKGWKVSITDLHTSDLGGVKFATLLIEGDHAYGWLRFESGVHRVQRVPRTESGGRIHTSTASVVVLPESEDSDIALDPSTLKIETFRASGPGGQHMQKNETAVRVVHLPTGITVVCQDDRSQHRNRERALRILRARLQDLQRAEEARRLGQIRRATIGTGDRSEKIRTYNFPQNRVTDHRIHLTLHQLDQILDGDLDPLVEALLAEEERRRVAELHALEHSSKNPG